MERQRLGDEPVIVTVLGSQSTREELIEAIELMNHEAKREQCIIGNEEFPSRWDSLHEFIDELIVLLVR